MARKLSVCTLLCTIYLRNQPIHRKRDMSILCKRNANGFVSKQASISIHKYINITHENTDTERITKAGVKAYLLNLRHFHVLCLFSCLCRFFLLTFLFFSTVCAIAIAVVCIGDCVCGTVYVYIRIEWTLNLISLPNCHCKHKQYEILNAIFGKFKHSDR